jgi:pectate lyase
MQERHESITRANARPLVRSRATEECLSGQIWFERFVELHVDRRAGGTRKRLKAVRSSIEVIAGAALVLGCSSVPRSVEDTGMDCPPPDLTFVADSNRPSTFDECARYTGAPPPDAAADQPIGWASIDDLGRNGTTGGLGGEVVLARSVEELDAFAARAEPLLIQICGEMGTGVEEINVGSNKTLLGVGSQPTLHGALDIRDVENVVVRNLFVQGANPEDGISLRRSHHVWIDHVDISDSADGNLDVSDESNYVTISFTRFWYRTAGQQHRFSNLIGSGDDNLTDEGKLKVTLHHNWWADNVKERMPRTRFGEIHVFDNLYSSRDNNKCIEAGKNARVLVENNYFFSVSDPLVFSGGGNLMERGNTFWGTLGTRLATGQAFEPPYAYQADTSCEVPAIVSAGAGARLNL